MPNVARSHGTRKPTAAAVSRAPAHRGAQVDVPPGLSTEQARRVLAAVASGAEGREPLPHCQAAGSRSHQTAEWLARRRDFTGRGAGRATARLRARCRGRRFSVRRRRNAALAKIGRAFRCVSAASLCGLGGARAWSQGSAPMAGQGMNAGRLRSGRPNTFGCPLTTSATRPRTNRMRSANMRSAVVSKSFEPTRTTARAASVSRGATDCGDCLPTCAPAAPISRPSWSTTCAAGGASRMPMRVPSKRLSASGPASRFNIAPSSSRMTAAPSRLS